MLTRRLEVEACFTALSLDTSRGGEETASKDDQGVAETTMERGSPEPMEGGAFVVSETSLAGS